MKHVADVKTAVKGGDTPLYVASQNGHVELVRDLLNLGVDVNTKNKKVLLLCT
jgi:ankyrin repeat protein